MHVHTFTFIFTFITGDRLTGDDPDVELCRTLAVYRDMLRHYRSGGGAAGFVRQRATVRVLQRGPHSRCRGIRRQ